LVFPQEPPIPAGTPSPPEPSTIVFVFSGPIARADIPLLCERVRVLLEGSHADLVVCDVGALADPDAVTIDVLARLRLTARRLGRRVGLLDTCSKLQDLLTLTGLSDVVPPCEELALEKGRQTEQREPAGGVEEEADPTEPIP
jgi:ABC-type transporter Mla MlaB component